MGVGRVDYVVDGTGLDDPGRVRLCDAALKLVASTAATAETDMPWSQSPHWPPHVLGAATRLRERFVPVAKHDDGYLQTRVQRLADEQTRADFVTFAPYALDASLWSSSGEHLASLADAGESCVVRLSDTDRDALVQQIGAGRVIALAHWRAARPGLVRRLATRLLRPPSP